jgi:hypothetical protein
LLISYYFSCGQTQECCESREVWFHVHVCILSGRISKRPGWCRFTSRQRNALCSRVANNIKLFRTRARGRGGRKAVEKLRLIFPFFSNQTQNQYGSCQWSPPFGEVLCSCLVFPPPPVYYCVAREAPAHDIIALAIKKRRKLCALH